MTRTKHGFLTNKKNNKLPKFYVTWVMMKQRCLNPNQEAYKRYGGRGIKVCDEWLEFENFYNDMFDSYQEHLKEYGKVQTTLERIDNSKGYCKENCRWATIIEQANNKRSNVSVEYKGEKFTIAQFCRKYNLEQKAFNYKYFERKWEFYEIFNNLPEGQKDYTKKIADLRNIFINNDISILLLRWQMILIYRFGLKDNIVRNLIETGRKFKVSKQMIYEIQTKAIKKLIN